MCWSLSKYADIVAQLQCALVHRSLKFLSVGLGAKLPVFAPFSKQALLSIVAAVAVRVCAFAEVVPVAELR